MVLKKKKKNQKAKRYMWAFEQGMDGERGNQTEEVVPPPYLDFHVICLYVGFV